MLVVIIALVIAGLATFDKFLATAQAVEGQHLAQQSHLDGLRLRRAGKIKEAVDALRKAYSLERRNTEYELELVDSLIAAGQIDRPELLIHDVLERQPNDGRANLLGAHLMLAEGEPDQAESYYHRAIHGEWPTDAVAHRVAVRMELVDFLAARGKRQDLLAELLVLQEKAGRDPATEERLARLFLVAGSPSRAADEYRAVIKQNPKDAAAYLGLGEAELQRGEYHLAHKAFLAASNYNPGEASIRRQVELSDTLAALDPTSRKLTSMEKYRRSLRILDLARSGLERCAAGNLALASDETRQLLASANDALTSTPPVEATNEIAENVLNLVERTWQARIEICGPALSQDEDPLRLIMDRLAQ
ncbi:MAG: tetratricopeptide repeat protein [Acidobacteriota bacterium]|nr:tetratricopeptide repeat protein [Acidobacteriota bacterium]